MKQILIGAAVTSLISVVASLLLVLMIMSAIGSPVSNIIVALAVFCPFVVAFPTSAYLFHQKVKLGETLKALEIAHQELAEAHLRLSEKARHDDMTGLLNRETFLAALKTSRRRSDCGSLLIIDADHFKHINDTHGHGEGDIALLMIAEAIQTGIRTGDLVGRIGGEEFAAFLADANKEEAMRIAERIRQAVETLHFVPEGGHPVPLSVSIGGTRFYPNLSVKGMMRAADNSLYQAKASGRNRIVFSEPARHLIA